MQYKVTVYNRNEDTHRYEKNVDESSPALGVIDDEFGLELIRMLLHLPYCTGRVNSKGVTFTWYPDEIHKEVHFFKK